MTRLIISAETQQDLQDIGDYIAYNNPAAALSFVTKLKHRCLEIAQRPGIGTKRDTLRTGLRSLAEGNYLIFFYHNTINSTVEIVRVLHAHRQLEEVFI